MIINNKAWEELHQKYKEWLANASVEEIAELLVYSQRDRVDVSRNARVLQQRYRNVPAKETCAKENIKRSRYFALYKTTYLRGVQGFIKKQPEEFQARLYSHLKK